MCVSVWKPGFVKFSHIYYANSTLEHVPSGNFYSETDFDNNFHNKIHKAYICYRNRLLLQKSNYIRGLYR